MVNMKRIYPNNNKKVCGLIVEGGLKGILFVSIQYVFQNIDSVFITPLWSNRKPGVG